MKRPVSIILSLLIFITALSGCTATDSRTDSVSSQAESQIMSSATAGAGSVSSAGASSVQSVSSTVAKATMSTNGAKLKVHYIDVGQGDSEFLELPNGQTMLIDAGNPENGADIVSYIKSLGHSKIDYLIATHPHSDHIGGMATVVNKLDIGKIYMPKVSQTTKVYENLLTAISGKGLKVNTAKSGINILKVGALNIDMIAPCGTSYQDLNQYSAVIMITYGENKFLFMGDAGNVSEAQITADVKADVLKVGHHGSNTASSEEFLQKVSPKYAVIEVGKGNSYGHPAAATLAKLQKVGAQVFRTDESGTITITSDGKNITIDKKSSSIKEQAPPSSNKSGKATEAAVNQTAGTNDDQNVTVYVTSSGKKYHTDGCRTLKKSKTAMSFKEAKAKGYEPCGICNPPE